MKFVKYEDRHFALIHKWNSQDEISKKIGLEGTPTEEETQSLIDNWTHDPYRIFLLIEHNDKLIGYFTICNINKKYESADIHPTIGEEKYRGSVIGTKLIDEILDLCFNYLKLHRVNAFILGNNPKLIRTAKNYGWTLEGIMKDFYKLRNERIDNYIFRMLDTEFKRRSL